RAIAARLPRPRPQSAGEKALAAFGRKIEADVRRRVAKNIHRVPALLDQLHLEVEQVAVHDDAAVGLPERFLRAVANRLLRDEDRVVLRIDVAVELIDARLTV